MKLEHVGPTFSIFDGMPAKFTQKLLWLVLADKNSTGAIYVWFKAHSNDYSTIGQNWRKTAYPRDKVTLTKEFTLSLYTVL